MRKLVSKIRYFSQIGGLPYYQRRVPERLKGITGIPNNVFKQRLKADINDDMALVAEIKVVNEGYQRLIDAITHGQNQTHDQIHRLAVDRLNQFDLKPLAPNAPSYALEALDQELHEKHFLDPLYEWQNAMDKAQQYIEPNLVQKVAEEAVAILKGKKVAGELHLFTQARDYYIEYKLKDNNGKESKNLKRDKVVLNDFIDSAGDFPIDTETIESALAKYIDKRALDNVKRQTIERELIPIRSALKNFSKDKMRKTVHYEVPSIPKTVDDSVGIRMPLDHQQQIEVMDMLKDDYSWKTLFVILSLHSGMSASESNRLRDSNFYLDSEIPFFAIPSGKSTERPRAIPLVYGLKKVEKCIEQGGLKVLSGKSHTNISTQISKLLKKVDPVLSSYSLRHTLAHNMDSASVDSSIKSAAGGWSGKTVGIRSKVVGYGKGLNDANERLLPLRDALKKSLQHLM